MLPLGGAPARVAPSSPPVEPAAVCGGGDAEEPRRPRSKAAPLEGLRVGLHALSLSYARPPGEAKEGGRVFVLQPLSGYFPSSTLCFILGASGSGKSSLLALLAGRGPPHRGARPAGRVTYDGEPRPPSSPGFVQQGDALLPFLTVAETMAFAAELRGAPRCAGSALLSRLGLESCAHTRAGAASGGQRRRLSVGAQLLRPLCGLLLCDEPTSGLDAFAASALVETLAAVVAGEGGAGGGGGGGGGGHVLSDESHAILPRTTVIAAIHQPRADAFSRAHTILLLAPGGRCAYFGPCEAVGEHFSALGCPCPRTTNLADHLLDITTGVFITHRGAEERGGGSQRGSPAPSTQHAANGTALALRATPPPPPHNHHATATAADASGSSPPPSPSSGAVPLVRAASARVAQRLVDAWTATAANRARRVLEANDADSADEAACASRRAARSAAAAAAAAAGGGAAAGGASGGISGASACRVLLRRGALNAARDWPAVSGLVATETVLGLVLGFFFFRLQGACCATAGLVGKSPAWNRWQLIALFCHRGLGSESCILSHTAQTRFRQPRRRRGGHRVAPHPRLRGAHPRLLPVPHLRGVHARQRTAAAGGGAS